MHSYSSILAIGHKGLDGFWTGPVVVQEKVDGSQFTFGIIDGEFRARSKRADILSADGMFRRAYEYASGCALTPEWLYRAEAVCSPRHNTIAYSRAAKGGIVLFDIDTGNQHYLPQDEVEREAARLGVDYAPVFDVLAGPPDSYEPYLSRESVLGGSQVEGVVLKNYALYGPDHKVLMGKVVRADFKEVNKENWAKHRASPVEGLIEQYRTDARWHKAIQHLREADALVNAPQDIPAIMREVSEDVLRECEEEIKNALFKRYWKDISRGITRGIPEFYKELLASGGGGE